MIIVLLSLIEVFRQILPEKEMEETVKSERGDVRVVGQASGVLSGIAAILQLQ